MKKNMTTAILPILLIFSPACVIVDPHDGECIGDYCHERYGDIRFFWSFEEFDGGVTDSCFLADVSRMDVYIYDQWGRLEFQVLDRPCEEWGAEITNFLAGTYELRLVGICPAGWITHEGWWELEVYPGMNDFGTLVLDYLRSCS